MEKYMYVYNYIKKNQTKVCKTWIITFSGEPKLEEQN